MFIPTHPPLGLLTVASAKSISKAYVSQAMALVPSPIKPVGVPCVWIKFQRGDGEYVWHFAKGTTQGLPPELSGALTLSQSRIIAYWLLPVSILWLQVQWLLMSFSLAGPFGTVQYSVALTPTGLGVQIQMGPPILSYSFSHDNGRMT